MSETNIDVQTGRPMMGAVPIALRAPKRPIVVGLSSARHHASPNAMLSVGVGAADKPRTDLAPQNIPQSGLYRTIAKRAMDICLVLATAPVAIALVGASALLLWAESGSPFYRQDRLGKDGKRFSILKLRTMVRNADETLESYLAADPDLRREWDEHQKLKNDPRITRVGGMLRKTSLDELPQLWNVLTGDMSLVGPRPMLPEQLEMYGDARHYNALRPGITGLWQVSQRNENGFRMRAKLDRTYNQTLSLREDLKVLLRTVGAVLKRTGY